LNLADAMNAGSAMLLDALSVAGQQSNPRLPQITFRHPLAIAQATRRTLNVGPFAVGGYAGTVMSVASRSNVEIGASFRQIIDVADWDASVATNAPGQSQWPRSPHFADLAKLWAGGEYFPLVFSKGAIQKNAESTLTLQPR
jgi:penicillin amidase